MDDTDRLHQAMKICIFQSSGISKAVTNNNGTTITYFFKWIWGRHI